MARARSLPLLLSLSLGSLGVATTAHVSPAEAGGWQEMHQTSDDVRIIVGADGIAHVQHHMRYRVVAGRFKTIDIAGIHPSAKLDGSVGIEAEKGGAVSARAETSAKTEGTVRLAIDEPAKGLGRGVYLIDVSYAIDLVAAKLLSRDGAMWKLAWVAPPSPEGHDGARVVFELPASPTEPRLAAGDSASTTLPTLHRGADKDELELVRTHVPRGEAVTWAVRIDPKGFPGITAPELRPPPPPPAPPPSFARSGLASALTAIALAALAGTFAFLLRKKQHAVRAAAEASKARARPLVAIPWGLGPFVYGIVAAGAFAVLLWASPIVGALLVVVGMLLATHRAPFAVTQIRGPGTWEAVADEVALVPSRPKALPGDTLDLGITKGRLVALAIFGGIGLGAWLLRWHVPGIAFAAPIASMMLLPLFASGKRNELPASPRELASSLLRPTRDELARMLDLSHVELGTIARVVPGASRGVFDDVRLACAPVDRTPGLRAIELALAAPPGARAALPEVLVRFDEGSEAAARIAGAKLGASVVTGRAPEEKVCRIVPADPTARGAARELARLLENLEGRRASDRKDFVAAPVPPPKKRYRGPERRTRLAAPAAMAM